MTYYNIIDKDIKNNSGYGVKITKERIVNNITNDYSSVSRLVDACNNYNVDYEHFDDVLENFLSDEKTF